MSFLQKIMGKNSKKDKSKGRKMAPEKGLKGAAALATSLDTPSLVSTTPQVAAQPRPLPKTPEVQVSVAAAAAATPTTTPAPPPKLKGKKSRAQPSASSSSQANENMSSQSPKEPNQALASSSVQDGLTAKHKVESQEPVILNPPTIIAEEKSSSLNKSEVTLPIQISALETSSSNSEGEKGVSQKSKEVPVVTKNKSGRASKATQQTKVSQQGKEEKPKDVQVADKPKALLTTESRELPKQSTNATQTAAGIRFDTKYVEVAHVTKSSTHVSSWLHDKLVLETQVVAMSSEAAWPGPSPREALKTQAGGSNAQVSETTENRNSSSSGPAIVRKIEESEPLDKSKQSTPGCVTTSKRISDTLWTALETFERQINQDKTSQASISKQKENMDEDHKTRRGRTENVYPASAPTTTIQPAPEVDEVRAINTEKLQKDKDERPEEEIIEQANFTEELKSESSTAAANETKNESQASEQKANSNDIDENTSEKPCQLEKELESAIPTEATADKTKTESLMSEREVSLNDIDEIISKSPCQLGRALENVIPTEATLSEIPPIDIIQEQTSTRAKDDLQEILPADVCSLNDDKVQELDTKKSIELGLQDPGEVTSLLSPDKDKPEALCTITEAPAIPEEKHKPSDGESAYRKELVVTDEAIGQQEVYQVIEFQQVQKQVSSQGLKQEKLLQVHLLLDNESQKPEMSVKELPTDDCHKTEQEINQRPKDIKLEQEPLTHKSNESTWPDRNVEDVADKLADITVNFGVIEQIDRFEEIEADSKQEESVIENPLPEIKMFSDSTEAVQNVDAQAEISTSAVNTSINARDLEDQEYPTVEIGQVSPNTETPEQVIMDMGMQKVEVAILPLQTPQVDEMQGPDVAHVSQDTEQEAFNAEQNITPDSNDKQPTTAVDECNHAVIELDKLGDDGIGPENAGESKEVQPGTEHLASDFQLRKLDVIATDAESKVSAEVAITEQQHIAEDDLQKPEVTGVALDKKQENHGDESEQDHADSMIQEPAISDVAVQIENDRELEVTNTTQHPEDPGQEMEATFSSAQERDPQIADAAVEKEATSDRIDVIQAHEDVDIREEVSFETDEQREALCEPGVAEVQIEVVNEYKSKEQELQMTDAAVEKEPTSGGMEITQASRDIDIREEVSSNIDEQREAMVEAGVTEGEVKENKSDEQELQMTNATVEKESTSERKEMQQVPKEDISLRMDEQREEVCEPGVVEVQTGDVREYETKEQVLQRTDTAAESEPTNDGTEITEASKDITIREEASFEIDEQPEAICEPEIAEVQLGGVNGYKSKEEELQMTDAVAEKEPTSDMIEITQASQDSEIREEVSSNIDEQRKAIVEPGEASKDITIREEASLEIDEQREAICEPEIAEIQIGGVNGYKSKEQTDAAAEKEPTSDMKEIMQASQDIDIREEEVSSNIEEEREALIEPTKASKDITVREEASFEIDEQREAICEPEIAEVQIGGANEYESEEQELQTTDAAAEKAGSIIDIREEEPSNIDEQREATVEPGEAAKDITVKEEASFEINEQREAICEPEINEVQIGGVNGYESKESELQVTDAAAEKDPTSDRIEIMPVSQDIDTREELSSNIDEHKEAILEPGVAQIQTGEVNENKYDEQEIQTGEVNENKYDEQELQMTNTAVEKEPTSESIEIKQAPEDTDISEDVSFRIEEEKEAICEPVFAEVQTGDVNEYKPKEQVLQRTDTAIEKEPTNDQTEINQAPQDITLREEASFEIYEQREAICEPEVAEKEPTSDKIEINQASKDVDTREKVSAICEPGVAQVQLKDVKEYKSEEQVLQTTDVAVEKEATSDRIEITQAPEDTDVKEEVLFKSDEQREAVCEQEYKSEEQVLQTTDAAVEKEATSDRIEITQAPEDTDVKEEVLFKADEQREAVCEPDVAAVVEMDGSQQPDDEQECGQNTSAINNQNKQKIGIEELHDMDAQDEPDAKITVDDQETNVCEVNVPSNQENDTPTKADTVEKDDHSHTDMDQLQHINDEPKLTEQKQECRDLNADQLIGSDIQEQAIDNIDKQINDMQKLEGTTPHLEEQEKNFDIIDTSDENTQNNEVHEQETEQENPTCDLEQIADSTPPTQPSLVQYEESKIGELKDNAAAVQTVAESYPLFTEISSSLGEITVGTKKDVPADSEIEEQPLPDVEEYTDDLTVGTKKDVPADSEIEEQPSPDVEEYTDEVEEIEVVPEADEKRSLFNETNSVPILSNSVDEEQASIEAVNQNKNVREVEMTLLCATQGSDQSVSTEQKTKELQFAQILTLPAEQNQTSSALDAHDNELQIAEETNEQVENPEANNIGREQVSSVVCSQSIELENVEQFDKQVETDKTVDADNESSDVWNPEVVDASSPSEQWNKKPQDHQSTIPPTEKEQVSGVVEIQDNELEEVQPTNAQVDNSQSNSGDEQKNGDPDEVPETEEEPSVQQPECKQSTGAVNEESSGMEKENEETQAGAQHNGSLKAHQDEAECEALAIELEGNSANRECDILPEDDVSLKMSVKSEETVCVKAENAIIDVEECQESTEEKQSVQQPDCKQSTSAVNEDSSSMERENEERQAGAQHYGSLQASQDETECEALAIELEGNSAEKACDILSEDDMSLYTSEKSTEEDDTSLHTSKKSTDETVCVKAEDAVIDVEECQKSTKETICVEECQDKTKEINPNHGIVETKQECQEKEPGQGIENPLRMDDQEIKSGELMSHEVDEQQDAFKELESNKNQTETEQSVQQPECKESTSAVNEELSSMEKEKEDMQAGAQNNGSLKASQECEALAIELEGNSANKACDTPSEDDASLKTSETSTEETTCVKAEDAVVDVKASQDEAECEALAIELEENSDRAYILSEDDASLKMSEKSTEETDYVKAEDEIIDVKECQKSTEDTETQEKQSVQQPECKQSISAVNEESSGMEKENEEMQAGAQHNGSLKASQDDAECEALAIELEGNSADKVCDVLSEDDTSLKTSEKSTEETVCVKAEDAVIDVKECQKSTEETVCVKAEDAVIDVEECQDEAKGTNPTHGIVENKQECQEKEPDQANTGPIIEEQVTYKIEQESYMQKAEEVLQQQEEKLQRIDQTPLLIREEEQKNETQECKELTFEQEQRIDDPIADGVNPLRMDDQEIESGELMSHEVNEQQDAIEELESKTEALCEQNFPAAEVFRGLDATPTKADNDAQTEAAATVAEEVHVCDQPAQETSHGSREILIETHDRALLEALSCTQEAHTSQEVEVTNLASSGTERVSMKSFLEEQEDMRLEATSKSVDAETEKGEQQEHQIATDLLRSQQQVQGCEEVNVNEQETEVQHLEVNPDQAESITEFSQLEDGATFDIHTNDAERGPEEAYDKDRDVTQELNDKKEGTEQSQESNEVPSDEVFTEPRVDEQVTTLNEAGDGTQESEIIGALLETDKEGFKDATQDPYDKEKQNQGGYEVLSDEVFTEAKVEEQITTLNEAMDGTQEREITGAPLEADKDATQEPNDKEEAAEHSRGVYEVPSDEVFAEPKVEEQVTTLHKETDVSHELKITGAPFEADKDGFTDATQEPSDKKEATEKNQERDEVPSDEVFTETKVEEQVNKEGDGTQEIEIRGASLEAGKDFEDATKDEEEATKQKQGGNEVPSDEAFTEPKVEEQVNKEGDGADEIEIRGASLEADKDGFEDATNDKEEATKQNQGGDEVASDGVFTEPKVDEQVTTLNEERDGMQEREIIGAPLEANIEGFKENTQELNDEEEATYQIQGGDEVLSDEVFTEPKVEEQVTILNQERDGTQETEISRAPLEANKDGFKDATQDPNDEEEAVEQNRERYEVPSDEVFTEPKGEEQDTTLNEEGDGTQESEIPGDSLEADKEGFKDATHESNDEEEAIEQNQVPADGVFIEPKVEEQVTTLNEEQDSTQECEITGVPLEADKDGFKDATQDPNDKEEATEKNRGVEVPSDEVLTECKVEEQVTILNEETDGTHESEITRAPLEAEKDGFKDATQEPNDKEEAADQNQERDEVPCDEVFTEPKGEEQDTTVNEERDGTKETEITCEEVDGNEQEEKLQHLEVNHDQAQSITEDETTCVKLTNEAERGIVLIEAIVPPAEEHQTSDKDGFEDATNRKEEATEQHQERGESLSDEVFTEPKSEEQVTTPNEGTQETEIAGDHVSTGDTYISRQLVEDDNFENKEEALRAVNDAVEVKEEDREHEEQTLVKVTEGLEVIDVPIAAEGRAAFESQLKAYASESESDQLASKDEDSLPKHAEECKYSTLEEHFGRGEEENFSLSGLSADSSSANSIEAQTVVAEESAGATSTNGQLESDIGELQANGVALEKENECQEEKCDQVHIGHVYEEDTSNVVGKPQNDIEESEVANKLLNVETHMEDMHTMEVANIALEKTNETLKLEATESDKEGTERDDTEELKGQVEVDIERDDIAQRDGTEELKEAEETLKLDATNSIGVDKDKDDTKKRDDIEELEGPEETLQVEPRDGSEELEGAEEDLEFEPTDSIEVERERDGTEEQDDTEDLEGTEKTFPLEATGSIEVKKEMDDTEKKDGTEGLKGAEEALKITSIEVERERDDTEELEKTLQLEATDSLEVDIERDDTEKLKEAEEPLKLETAKSIEEGIETENTEEGDDMKELKGQEKTLQLEAADSAEVNIEKNDTKKRDDTEEPEGAEETLKLDSIRVDIERDDTQELKGTDEEIDRKEDKQNFEQKSAILGDGQEHSTHADEENNDLQQIDMVCVPRDGMNAALELEVTDAIGQSDELKDFDSNEVEPKKTDTDFLCEQNPTTTVNEEVASIETNTQLEIEATDTPLDGDKQSNESKDLQEQNVEPEQIQPELKCEQTHTMPGDEEVSSTNIGSETENEQQLQVTNQSPDTTYGMPTLEVRDLSVEVTVNKDAEDEPDKGIDVKEKETNLKIECEQNNTVVEEAAPSIEGDEQKDDLQKATTYGHEIVQADNLCNVMIEQSRVLIYNQIETPKSQEAVPTIEDDQIAAEKEQEVQLTELSQESKEIAHEQDFITISSQNKVEGSEHEKNAGEQQDLELRDVPLTLGQGKLEIESEQAFGQCDLMCEQPITALESEEVPAPSSQEKEHSADVQKENQELKAEGIRTGTDVQSDELQNFSLTNIAPTELQKQESSLVDEEQGPEDIDSAEFYQKVPCPVDGTEAILDIKQYKNEAEEQHNTVDSVVHQQESTVQDEEKDGVQGPALTTNVHLGGTVLLTDEDVQNHQAQEPNDETSLREIQSGQELACQEITPLPANEEQPCSDAHEEKPEVKDFEVKAEHQMSCTTQADDRVTCKDIDQAPDESEDMQNNEKTAQNIDRDFVERRDIYVNTSNVLLKELAPTEDDNAQNMKVVLEVLGEPNQKLLEAMDDSESQTDTNIHATEQKDTVQMDNKDELEQSYATKSENGNDTRVASILLTIEQQESTVVTEAESEIDTRLASILVTVEQQESTAVTLGESVIDTRVASILLTVEQQESTAGIDTKVASILLTVEQHESTAVTEGESEIQTLKGAVAAFEGPTDEAPKLEVPAMTTLEAFIVENEASSVVHQEEHMQNSKVPDAGSTEQNVMLVARKVDNVAVEPPPSTYRDKQQELEYECVPTTCLYQKRPTNEGNDVIEPKAAGGKIATIENTLEQENLEKAGSKHLADERHGLAVQRQLKLT